MTKSVRIWHILIPESRAPSSGLTYELAYEARVAIDALRFAIKLDHELTPETRQSTALVLLDALNCLVGAERHFRIERVPLHGEHGPSRTNSPRSRTLYEAQ